MLAIVAAENVLRLLPRGTHEWEKFVPPEELSKIVERVRTKEALIQIYDMSLLFLTCWACFSWMVRNLVV